MDPHNHPTSDDVGYAHCSSSTRADGFCPFTAVSKALPLWDGLRDLDANLDEIVTTLKDLKKILPMRAWPTVAYKQYHVGKVQVGRKRKKEHAVAEL